MALKVTKFDSIQFSMKLLLNILILIFLINCSASYKELNGKTNPSPFITGNKLVSVGVINFDNKGDKIDYFKFLQFWFMPYIGQNYIFVIYNLVFHNHI